MRVAVGLSGGVDSSVAAVLLKEAGHDVVGVTMRLWKEGRYRGGDRDACFGPGEAEDIATAGAFASAIGIEHHVFDCSDIYEEMIVRHYREASLSGRTPNPCVLCNAGLKFGMLPAAARASGLVFDCFATGHYARIVRSENGRLAVARASDASKDQSYFLYRLSQEQLAGVVFPLGTKTKVDVRAIAAARGLAAADRPDSQDFYSGDRRELIGAVAREGEIVDLSGKVVGRHEGFWNFTIGQRKGIGVFGPEPHYVIRIDPCHNRVVVGSREEAFRTRFVVNDVVWSGCESTDRRLECHVKIRSTGAPIGPVYFENGVCDVPGEGLFGVAPGQSAVFYSSSGEIICGGVIDG